MSERSEPPSGVGVIVTDTPFGRHVVDRLVKQQAGGPHPVKALFCLHKKSKAETDRKKHRSARIPGSHRLRRLISAKVQLEHEVWLEETAAAKEFVDLAGPIPEWPEVAAIRETSTKLLNAPENVSWVISQNLRLLVLAGAPILKPEMLATVPDVLNMHSSLLPSYRGTRAEFWQYHNDELDRAGVSVHYVTAGVDAGDIILQAPLDPDPIEGPWIMRIKNQLNGLDALPRAVVQVLNGKAERRPQDETAERAYRYSDINDDAVRRVLDRMHALKKAAPSE